MIDLSHSIENGMIGYRGFPAPVISDFLSRGAAKGAAPVGIDSLNIDDASGGTRPVHTTLLGADPLIVEHPCNLDRPPPSGFTFAAVPAKVRAMGTLPVPAYATVPRA